MANQSIPTQPLEPRELVDYGRIAHSLVEGLPPMFRLGELRRRHWVCVAVEDELVDEAASRLASACAERGFAEIWSVELPSSPAIPTTDVRRTKLTVESIEELRNDIYLGSCYVLIEAQGRFAVATDGDMYWMLAGPRDFVEAALGCRIETQSIRFRAVVEAYTRGPDSGVANCMSAVHAVAQASLQIA